MNARISLGLTLAAGVDTRENTRVDTPSDRGAGRDPEKVANWTKARGVRVPDDLWNAAKERAAERGETVTEAIVAFLRRYTK